MASQYAETPGRVIDGTNGTFTLMFTPAPAASIALYLNGIRQTLGLQFNIMGNFITYETDYIPRVNSVHLCNYTYIAR
jgi:hypothetical protein